MEFTYREDVKNVMDELLLSMPSVKASKMFSLPCYKVGKKAFIALGDDGIVVKLPEERVASLVTEDENITIFEPMEGRVWKEWASIDLENAEAYHGYRELFEESLAFVGGG